MDYSETTIKSENIYEGKIINLRVDSVELPNRKYSKREVVIHGDVAAIIGIKDNKLVMLKHFRKPVEDVLIEIPAGCVEKGETPIETAKREFEEETGMIANDLEYLIMTYSSPGYSTEKIHFFISNNITESDVSRDDEAIEVFYIGLDELKNKIDNLEIQDAKTVLAYYLAKEWINANNWYYKEKKG